MVSLLIALHAPALACGGFNCDSPNPPWIPDASRVDQTNERVLFMVDDGTIDVHVEVGYEGGAEDFAWIVPVPEIPELRPSSREIFDRIDAETAPRFSLTRQTEGTCKERRSRFRAKGFGSQDASFDMADTDDFEEPSVTIASQQAVGPYEAVTLQGDSAELILDWLVEHGFALSEELEPRLAPYVADGSWFVALRMRKDRSTGELVPLGMRYPGTEPVIPLQLTGIAAVPDMRLEIFVVGDARAVPENYLHLRPNPFAIDWLAGGSNYEGVITRAADEAGGHGFATDASIPARFLGSSLLWSSGRYRPEQYAEVSTLREFADVFDSVGIPLTDGTVAYFAQGLPFTDEARNRGWDDLGLWQCVVDPNCVFGLPEGVLAAPVDGEALAMALGEWATLMEDVQTRLNDPGSHITRLRSSISPEEMSLDPRFVFNGDMSDVNPERSATLTTLCRPGVFEEDAPRRLELEDGRTAYLAPSSEYPGWDASVGALQVHANELVEATARTGAPMAIADNREAIAEALAAHTDEFAYYTTSGCGCSSTRGMAGGLALLPALLMLRRRRRA